MPDHLAGKTVAVAADRPGRNAALDGFRALGVLAVMALHLGIPQARLGFMGVDVFFVLSGYLITSYLVAEWDRRGTLGFRRFYIRRLLRLVPALVPLLIVCGALVPRADQVATALGVANWAMVLNLVPGMGERLFVHTWSLAAEWQYYLIWPPIFLLLARLRLPRAALAGLLVALAVASGMWRGFVWQATGDLTHVHYGVDTRSDGLLLGTAVALLFSLPPVVAWLRHRRLVRPATWLAFLATVGMLVSGAPESAFLAGGQSALVIGAALLLCGLLLDPPRALVRFLGHPALAWVGKISYGLYLWHLPIHGYLQSVRGFPEPIVIAGTLALSFAAAALSYYLIELPALQLKDHFGGPVSQSLPVAAPAPTPTHGVMLPSG